MYENQARDATKKLAEMQQPEGPMNEAASRQSAKAFLLDQAERLRKEAHGLEVLAYRVEGISGEAEQMLWHLVRLACRR